MLQTRQIHADYQWPEKSMADILELAFKSQVIDSPDSQVLRILQGRV